MMVILHVEDNGNVHWIDTDPMNYMKVDHPDNHTGPVGVDVMLRHHNENPLSREVGGWNLPSDVFDEEPGLTRWQRLVRACNHPEAHAQAKALGLKE